MTTGGASLLQPLFGVLLVGAFPELEVEGGGVAVGLEGAELVAGLHLLAALDAHLAQLAV